MRRCAVAPSINEIIRSMKTQLVKACEDLRSCRWQMKDQDRIALRLQLEEIWEVLDCHDAADLETRTRRRQTKCN